MVKTAQTNGPPIVFSYFSFSTSLGEADCDRYIFFMSVCYRLLTLQKGDAVTITNIMLTTEMCLITNWFLLSL